MSIIPYSLYIITKLLIDYYVNNLEHKIWVTLV